MNTTLAVLGAMGGACALITIIAVLLRAIFKQVSATEGNTKATDGLTAMVKALIDKIAGLETRVAILEDHEKRRSP